MKLSTYANKSVTKYEDKISKEVSIEGKNRRLNPKLEKTQRALWL